MTHFNDSKSTPTKRTSSQNVDHTDFNTKNESNSNVKNVSPRASENVPDRPRKDGPGGA